MTKDELKKEIEQKEKWLEVFEHQMKKHQENVSWWKEKRRELRRELKQNVDEYKAQYPGNPLSEKELVEKYLDHNASMKLKEAAFWLLIAAEGTELAAVEDAEALTADLIKQFWERMCRSPLHEELPMGRRILTPQELIKMCPKADKYQGMMDRF